LEQEIAMHLPPPTVLDALRQPRRPQLGDLSIRRLLSEWKRRGRSIEYGDLNRVADLLGVARPDAMTRRKIVAAVEAAGIEIRNSDDGRQTIAETGRKVSPSGEELRWRWPEEWDSRQRNRVYIRRGFYEFFLEREQLQAGDEILPWPDWEKWWL
jgi:hypothetical protein